MSHTARLRVVAMAAAVTVASTAMVQVVAAAPARANPQQGLPTAVVSLGDSIAAGEGGRLAGNPDTSATDRGRVATYGATAPEYSDGCHRSDSAPLHGIPAQVHVNLACSGATAQNVRRTAGGGTAFMGEAPQADRLDTIARTHDVTAVVVTIGANDLGFGDAVANCVWHHTISSGTCESEWDHQTRVATSSVMARIGFALDDIRVTMTSAGYAASDFRLIVMGYPNLVAPPGQRRLNNAGCPFFSSDMQWMSQVMVPRLGGSLRHMARVKGAEFLDVSGALRGHELCQKDAVHSQPSRPAREVSEWVNWIYVPPAAFYKHDEQFHPNHYGQLALQQCLGMMAAAPIGDRRCVNAGPGQVSLSLQPLGTVWSSYAPAQVLTGNTAIPVNTCRVNAPGTAHLCFQGDGNLVLYWTGGVAKWATGTQTSGGTATLQWDGNLVVRAADGTALWHSDTWGNWGAELVLRDDGTIAILNPGGHVLWQKLGSTGGGGSGGTGGGGSGGGPIYEN